MVSSLSGPLALEMDEVFCDPQMYRQLLDYLASPEVVAQVDQEALAQRDATLEALTEAFVDRHGGQIRLVEHSKISDWIRLGAVSALAQWVAGESKSCMHIPSPRNTPFPVIAAAWKPGLVVCPQCQHLIAGLSAEEEMRCDCCGRITTMEEGGIYPLSISTGAIMYRAGSCASCIPDGMVVG